MREMEEAITWGLPMNSEKPATGQTAPPHQGEAFAVTSATAAHVRMLERFLIEKKTQKQSN